MAYVFAFCLIVGYTILKKIKKEAKIMNPEKRKHARIPLRDIHATPENGIYITKNDATQMGVFGVIFFIILGILAIFPRKK